MMTSFARAALGGLEDIRREALLERLVARRRSPGEEAVAAGCAGAPSNFIRPPTATTTIRVTWPDTPDEEQGESDVYTAEWWELETVRVENPEDSQQYVNTTRIKQIRYSRPDGSTVQLDNRPAFAAFPPT